MKIAIPVTSKYRQLISSIYFMEIIGMPIPVSSSCTYESRLHRRTYEKNYQSSFQRPIPDTYMIHENQRNYLRNHFAISAKLIELKRQIKTDLLRLNLNDIKLRPQQML